LYKNAEKLYNLGMAVTISEFRRNLFSLVEQAAEGKPVEFTYRGEVFSVAPLRKRRRLDGWKGLPQYAGLALSPEEFDQYRESQAALGGSRLWENDALPNSK
jgi:prevent-host-death family protein